VGLILDTSILVAEERGAFDLRALLRDNPTAPIGIAAITASELLQGALRRIDPAIRVRRLARIEAAIALLAVYSFGPDEARRHAELWAHLMNVGTPIGAHDMLIAATALARGDYVVTLNVAEFTRVPGLQLLEAQPYQR